MAALPQPMVYFYVLFAVLWVSHLIICIYVMAAPNAVAQALAEPDRSFAAWLYVMSLRVGRGDAEADILTPGLAPSVIAANVRRRAVINVLSSAFAFLVLAFVVRSAFAPHAL